MLNGWSFQLGKYGNEGRGGLETCCVESLVIVYLYVSLLRLGDAKREFLCP